eukprot:gb/GECH01001145.1/.p1 GENE.gb/GECH01001145.1/~~gb/GECH01001145.1/.p1  ORF type:complete len:1203 (+),score=269.53 gb/GECH01001145.1/:1-3609(+)
MSVYFNPESVPGYYNENDTGEGYVPFELSDLNYAVDDYEQEIEDSAFVPAFGLDNVDLSSTLHFDCYEELLWTGTDSGRVISYINSPEGIQKYSAYATSLEHAVEHVEVGDSRVFSLTNDSFRIHTKGGIPKATQKEGLSELLTFTHHNLQHRTYVYIGSANKRLFKYDATVGRIVKLAVSNEGVCAMKLNNNNNLLCCGGMHGGLFMYDPRTLNLTSSVNMFMGSITSIDCVDNLVFACGLSQSFNQFFVDPIVKIFDMRTNRLLDFIEFPAGPYFLKAGPPPKIESNQNNSDRSLLYVASQSGVFQPFDINTGESEFGPAHVPLEGQAIQSFDLSSNGEAICLGDTAGLLHGWSATEDLEQLLFNDDSKETATYSISSPSFNVSLDQYAPLQSGQGFDQGQLNRRERLLSDWPPNETYLAGQHPREIHPSIMNNLNTTDFVSYVINPGIKHPDQGYCEKKTFMNFVPSALGSNRSKLKPKQRRVRRKREYPRTEDGSSVRPKDIVPQGYNFIELKENLMEESIISRHNLSDFSGLDNRLENSYINPYLQVLFSLRPLRIAAMNHLCNKQFCLFCELGFLFYMLEQVKGGVCKQSNFLRTFRQLSGVAAFKLLEGVGPTELDSGTRIQEFSRFALAEMDKECMDDSFTVERKQFGPLQSISPENASDSKNLEEVNIINMIFSGKMQEIITCSCGSITPLQQYFMSLDLPRIEELNIKPSNVTFCDLVKYTLAQNFKLRKWCSRCNRYQFREHHLYAASMPHILSFHFPLEEEQTRWLRQQHHRRHRREHIHHQTSNTHVNENKRTHSKPSPHKERTSSHDSLPFYMIFHPDEKQQIWDVTEVNCIDEDENISSNSLVYELKAIISYVQDPFSDEDGHTVAAIKYPEYPNDQGYEWYLFNDFCIKAIPAKEAVAFTESWKIPCIMFYSLRKYENYLPRIDRRNPIPHDSSLFNDSSLSRIKPSSPSFKPLDAEEMPQSGNIVALDAEFVALKAEEMDIDEDGQELMREGVLSLARVSVVRGESEIWRQRKIKNEPFIDDHISIPEPIADHLTRYSGLVPGDLDPAVSPHHIVPLKNTYLKLRNLINRGVVFVGHGLANDFKIINIYVPPDQIIDTVHLFRFENQRMLSLRFLAFHLLGINIQSQTHDSIEDARTALALYDKYQELTTKNLVSEVLTQLYSIGRSCNWQITEDSKPELTHLFE